MYLWATLFLLGHTDNSVLTVDEELRHDFTYIVHANAGSVEDQAHTVPAIAEPSLRIDNTREVLLETGRPEACLPNGIQNSARSDQAPQQLLLGLDGRRKLEDALYGFRYQRTAKGVIVLTP
jgi:hypothetical protein